MQVAALTVSLLLHGVIVLVLPPPSTPSVPLAGRLVLVQAQAGVVEVMEPAVQREGGTSGPSLEIHERASVATGMGGTGDGPAWPLQKYYGLDELDIAPIPLEDVVPHYPEDAPALQGMVKLEMWLNERGGIDSLRVVDSEMPEVFSEAAAQAFLGTRFHPGYLRGNAVKSRIRIVVRFDLTA